MRHLRWVPLAFLAGQHGFAVFAPYATLMLALAHYMNRRGGAAPPAPPLIRVAYPFS